MNFLTKNSELKFTMFMSFDLQLASKRSQQLSWVRMAVETAFACSVEHLNLCNLKTSVNQKHSPGIFSLLLKKRKKKVFFFSFLKKNVHPFPPFYSLMVKQERSHIWHYGRCTSVLNSMSDLHNLVGRWRDVALVITHFCTQRRVQPHGVSVVGLF